MRNSIGDYDETDDENLTVENVQIEGIDQAKASGAWQKLKEQTKFNDQYLSHPKSFFCCVRGANKEMSKFPHFAIGILPPGSDPSSTVSEVDITLAQNPDRAFIVVQESVETGTTTPLTWHEVNLILDQIIESTRQ